MKAHISDTHKYDASAKGKSKWQQSQKENIRQRKRDVWGHTVDDKDSTQISQKFEKMERA